MSAADPQEFTVDLAAGEVRHASGAVVVFDPFPDRNGWHPETSAWLRNGHLFPGPETELIKRAREVAIAAGKKR